MTPFIIKVCFFNHFQINLYFVTHFQILLQPVWHIDRACSSPELGNLSKLVQLLSLVRRMHGRNGVRVLSSGDSNAPFLLSCTFYSFIISHFSKISSSRRLHFLIFAETFYHLNPKEKCLFAFRSHVHRNERRDFTLVVRRGHKLVLRSPNKLDWMTTEPLQRWDSRHMKPWAL